ncbi:MAG: hypothetical protein AAFV85_23145 [Cyanobacteria bacterium J06634_6]
MANLVKSTQFKVVDDLKDPTLGNIIKDESALMFSWAALGIAAILYIPGAGFISALAISYFGYRDVNATCREQGATENVKQSEGFSPSQSPSHSETTQPTQTPKPLPSGPTRENPQEEPEPEFIGIPWGKPRPSHKEAYQGDVYATPEQKAEAQKTAVALAEFRAPNINELLNLPIKKRAERLLADMALSGCNLTPYLYDKLIIATGTQRSGKSTIIVLAGILEAALLGKELRYITSDGDIYPVAFSGIANGAKYYGMATKEIEETQLDQANNVVWIFDEVTKQHPEVKSALWEQLLTGFVKTGASARLITHGTTMKAIGFPAGMADQVKSEAVIVKALRKSDAVGREAAAKLTNGGRYPSGEYRRQELNDGNLKDVQGEQLQIPDWLLFDTNEQGNPCYVRSLLRYFPELDARKNGGVIPELYPEPKDQYEDTRQNLERLLDTDAAHPVQAEVVDEDETLSANAAQFAQIVLTHLKDKNIKVVSLARLLCDNYSIKVALKQNSQNADIKAKGKETARQLAMKCKHLGLLTVEEKGGNSISLSAPPATLFGVV